jgi:hypothetical protein
LLSRIRVGLTLGKIYDFSNIKRIDSRLWKSGPHKRSSKRPKTFQMLRISLSVRPWNVNCSKNTMFNDIVHLSNGSKNRVS